VDGELQFYTTGIDLSDGVILWACDDCVDSHGITSRIRHCWHCDGLMVLDGSDIDCPHCGVFSDSYEAVDTALWNLSRALFGCRCWNCDEVYPVDTTHQCEALLYRWGTEVEAERAASEDRIIGLIRSMDEPF
jgi:hypothetical protein